MKILFFTDTHLALRVGNRKEGYAEQILDKWRWINDYALMNRVDLVVHGGDIYDKAIVPRWIEHEVGERIADCNSNFMAVVGSHDTGPHPSITSLRHHEGAVLAERLVDMKIPNSDFMVALIPATHSLPSHQSKRPGSIHNSWGNQHCAIYVAHWMVTKEPVPWGHKTTEQMAELLWDDRKNFSEASEHVLLLTGDYHPGFEVHTIENITFANPGALSRTFRSDTDFGRRPQVAVIEYFGDEFDVEYIEVECALPEDEVYDDSRRQTDEMKNKLRSSLAEAIEWAKKGQTHYYEQYIEAVRERDDIELPEGVTLDDAIEHLRTIEMNLEAE